MTIIDKKNILSSINDISDLKLELGCGSNKRCRDAVGIDAIDYRCVDIVGDMFDVLNRIPDRKVAFVYSHHFFEHIDGLDRLMDELARIMQEDGELVVVVPHFSNPYFHSDYTHKSRFGLYSFSYLSNDVIFSRKVPHYRHKPKFDLCRVKLVFKSPRPFYIRYGVKKLFEKIFNMHHYMQEFYEENLCYLIPCYEIRYEMKKLKDNR